MRVDQFDFHLPQERIALDPAEPRDSARLLHVAGATLADRGVADLPSLLEPGDILVLNDTKVIPAQLYGKRAPRADGAPVEIEATLHKALPQKTRDNIYWRAFLRPAKRVAVDDVIQFGDRFYATVEERNGAEAVLRFDLERAEFHERLAKYGTTPLPPYIARKRPAKPEDSETYQTIYAEAEGSVAAPTAGLHFTARLLDAIRARGVLIETITLHVGAGTFLPVTAEDTKDHIMHAEWGEISPEQAESINAARAAGRRIAAVGTTALRLLESAAEEDGRIEPFCGETDIFITPGYRFRAVDALLTNFHLPRSTLFMLVCAFAGVENMKAAYDYAIEKEYRFYSYGDACFLECYR